MASGKSKLGVHMIVRDEESNLPLALASIQGWVDEIIIVDTGSTDRTMEIARSYGAVVVEFPWGDDFASARNAGLAMVGSEWILVLDADETVVGGAGALMGFLDAASADQGYVVIQSAWGERPEEQVAHEAVRLFRAGKGYRYQGRIHEQIVRETTETTETVKTCSTIARSPLVLAHTGYLASELARKRTVERNLRLLRQELAYEPEHPFHTYNLAVTLCQKGELEEANVAFRRALRLTPLQAPYRPALVRDAAKVLEALEQYPSAYRLLHTETERYPDYPDLYMLLGIAAERIGLLAEAKKAYGAAARIGVPDPDQPNANEGRPLREPVRYLTEAGTSSYRPMTALADLFKRMGDSGKADLSYREALAMHPLYEPALIGWADLLQAAGEPDASIRERLLQITRSAGPQALASIARALAGCGAHAAALELLPRLGAGQEALVCECLLQTGQFAQAGERLAAWQAQRAGAGAPELAAAAVERWLLPEAAGPQAAAAPGPADPAPGLRELAARLLDRAVELRMQEVADRLTQMEDGLVLVRAKSLYRQGYILQGADWLLVLMSQSKLDGEGVFLLAETVYRKGYYAQAASLFEQALSLDPQYARARAGAAMSYLKLACEVATEYGTGQPGAEGLRADHAKLEQSIEALDGVEWQTRFAGKTRRNTHAETDDFVMYDRKG